MRRALPPKPKKRPTRGCWPACKYPSDVEAGLELGRQVAQQVIARAMADGSDAVWDGQMPTGPGYWSGEKPHEPLGGTWQTWVLASGDALRPPPPLAYDSPELAAELREIKAITHTWQLDQQAHVLADAGRRLRLLV